MTNGTEDTRHPQSPDAEPAGEAVAWRVTCEGQTLYVTDREPVGVDDYEVQPLYTHPAPAEPAGEWVTDEMVRAAIKGSQISRLMRNPHPNDTVEAVVRQMLTAALAAAPQPLPADSSAGEVEAAYREGWRVNAVTPEEQGEGGEEYLQGCEEFDWRNSAAAAAVALRTQTVAIPLPTGEAETIERCIEALGDAWTQDMSYPEARQALEALLPTPPVQSLQRGERT